MNFDLQFFVNIFAIIGGILGFIAYLDVRRKRYKLRIETLIEHVSLLADPLPHRRDYVRAFQIILINNGLITMYPLRFFMEINFKEKVRVFPTKPFDVLLPGRSLRFSFSKVLIYKKLPEHSLQRKWLLARPVVVLEDDLVCKGWWRPFLIDFDPETNSEELPE